MYTAWCNRSYGKERHCSVKGMLDSFCNVLRLIGAVVLALMVVSLLFTSEAVCEECEINGLDDFFTTPCDISGTYATPASRNSSSGITVIGSDLTLQLDNMTTSVIDLGNPGYQILQTRILMTYSGTLRIPILRFDAGRPYKERVTGSSRISYFVKGAIEWRSDVRDGTGRIEGGAWAPERPPDAEGSRVAGRAEPITFSAELDRDSLPCCETVKAGDSRIVFVVKKLGGAIQKDLGLGRGISFHFSHGNRETFQPCASAAACTADEDIAWYLGPDPSDRVFDLGTVQPLIVLPSGTIKGRLKSDERVETVANNDPDQEDNDVLAATINLWKQKDGFARSKKLDETDEQYQAYLDDLKIFVGSTRVEPYSSGRFTFTDVLFLELFSVDAASVLGPSYYILEATEAETEELDLATVGDDGSLSAAETYTLFFSNNKKLNVRPNPEKPIFEHEILLTPLDEIGAKESLVARVSGIGPNNYAPVEAKVQRFIEKVKDEKKPEQLEALRRGILAERMVLSGAQFADQLITTMLDGLIALINDVIDDFIGGKNKKLAEKEKELKELGEKLQLDRLRENGWKGFSDSEGAVATVLNEEMRDLVEGDGQLAVSFMGKVIKAGTDALYYLVKKVLVAVKMEKSSAAGIAKNAKTAVDTMLGIAITQGAGGGKALAKRLVGEIIKSQKKSLLDGQVAYSYTSLTRDTLKKTLTLMESWDDDDREAFLLARGEFNSINNALGYDVLVAANSITAFSSEIAGALGGVGVDIIELLGPHGRTVAKVAKVVKYISNALTFGVPFVMVYGKIGGPNTEVTVPLPVPGLAFVPGLGVTVQLGAVERGAATAFGLDALPDTSAGRLAPETPAAMTANPHMSSAVADAQAELQSVLTALAANLEEDLIRDALSVTSGTAETALLNAFETFDRSVSYVIYNTRGTVLQDEAVIEKTQALVGLELDVKVSYAELLQMLSDLYFKVLLVEFSGPGDILYIAERNKVLSAIDALAKNVDGMAEDALTVFGETQDAIVLPAVVVDNISVLSDVSGAAAITTSPEAFTVSAHIKNISASDLSGLSARLSVTSVEETISVATPLETAVGTGALGPDDGTVGNGTDEADVVWQVTYSGDPSVEERILFTVDILESGADPVAFRAFSNAITLEPEISLTDGDLDGLPDAWEKENGLDNTKDDSADDPDNDGLSNSKELDAGTDPQMADTDGDGLSDGEETAGGKDGFVTDPLNTDTDDDGVPDNLDGQPVDGGTSEKPALVDMPSEPEVAVDKTEVALTQEERVATVAVTNSGSGTLTWTAVSGNKAIVVVSPDASDLRNGDGLILFSTPAGYDFDTPGKNVTTVKVIDLAGTTNDFKEITVKVGIGEERMPIDDEDNGDNGTDNRTACPLAKAASIDEETLDVLRAFRDSVLRANPASRRYVDLYYQYGAEADRILKEDSALRQDVRRCIFRLLPTVHKMLKGTPETFNRNEKNLIKSCLEKIAARANPALKQEIEELIRILQTGDIFTNLCN